MVLGVSEGFSEPLEVHDLALPQVADGIADIRILDDAQDVVVGAAGLLLWRDLVKTTYKNTRKNR